MQYYTDFILDEETHNKVVLWEKETGLSIDDLIPELIKEKMEEL